MLIPFVPRGAWQTIPYQELVKPHMPASVLDALVRGKIVLVGSYIQAHRDVVTTPLGLLPGVEVQAAILAGN